MLASHFTVCSQLLPKLLSATLLMRGVSKTASVAPGHCYGKQCARRAAIIPEQEECGVPKRTARATRRNKVQRIALQRTLAYLIDDPELCCISVHIAAAFDPHDYAPDQRALLATHGLFWLEHALAKPDGSGAYGAIEIYDALWLLYEQEAVAVSAALGRSERVA